MTGVCMIPERQVPDRAECTREALHCRPVQVACKAALQGQVGGGLEHVRLACSHVLSVASFGWFIKQAYCS